jgi:hypothetical protein
LRGVLLLALAPGARLALMFLFLLSGAEKALTLRARSAAWHPVILANPVLRPHAALWATASLAWDVTAAILVVLWPTVGLTLCASALLVYTAVGGRVQTSRGETCRCFWKLLDTSSRSGLIIRNVSLLALVLLGAMTQTGDTISFGAVLASVSLLLVIAVTTLGADRLGGAQRLTGDRTSSAQDITLGGDLLSGSFPGVDSAELERNSMDGDSRDEASVDDLGRLSG